MAADLAAAIEAVGNGRRMPPVEGRAVIVCRSAAELERMRAAGRLVGEVLTELTAAVAPGVTHRRSRRAGGEADPPGGRDAGVQGVSRVSGDDLRVDQRRGDSRDPVGPPGAERGRHHLDRRRRRRSTATSATARSRCRSGQVSEEAATLLRVTEESLYKAIEQVRPGGRVSDIGHAVQQHVEAYGFSVVREFVGHGIGQQMHEEPQVPNYGEPGRGPRLAEGMVLAIEPMVNAGKPAVKVLADGWTAVTRDTSLSAHFEHTVAVTAGEPWILTAREVPVSARRVAGVVVEQLPSALYRVRLDEGPHGDWRTSRIGSIATSSGCWSAIGCGWSCRRSTSGAGGS